MSSLAVPGLAQTTTAPAGTRPTAYPFVTFGIDSFLQVYEGQSHAQYGRDDRIPEVREAFSEIGTFMNAHLKQ